MSISSLRYSTPNLLFDAHVACQARCVELSADMSVVFVQGEAIEQVVPSFTANGTQISFAVGPMMAVVTVAWEAHNGREVPRVTLTVDGSVVQPTLAGLTQDTKGTPRVATPFKLMQTQGQEQTNDSRIALSAARTPLAPHCPNIQRQPQLQPHEKNTIQVNRAEEEKSAWQGTLMGRLGRKPPVAWQEQHRRLVLARLTAAAKTQGRKLIVLNTRSGPVAFGRSV
jgi:hypothetical protein